MRPGIVVCEQSIKVQISALRKALGADRNLIRTEFGRGYRLIGIVRSNARPPQPQASKVAGLSSFVSAERSTIAAVWFQFELVAETSTNAHVGYFGAPDRSLN